MVLFTIGLEFLAAIFVVCFSALAFFNEIKKFDQEDLMCFDKISLARQDIIK